MQANKNGFFYVLDRHHRRVHLGVAVRAAQLGDGHRQEDRPAVHSSATRSTDPQPVTILPGADRRAQLVADVVQSADRPRVHPVVDGHVDDLHLQPGFRIPGRREEYRHRPRRPGPRQAQRGDPVSPPAPGLAPIVPPLDRSGPRRSGAAAFSSPGIRSRSRSGGSSRAAAASAAERSRPPATWSSRCSPTDG